ncbi:MAG: type VI secretion system-associated protein [Candidatus Cloacimonetes bacterium 4572_55]|nr:MAG: type VI secretion system-associated protein [Candidatus Cloacimonetes bacterium 4572_55]
MAKNQKIIWFEGMTLDPHHFQQWDRYNQWMIHFRSRSLVPFCVGFSELRIDSEAVNNGRFLLNRCSGVTPGGLAFDMPEIDLIPEERSFRELYKPTAESISVFLTIPPDRFGGNNCTLRENLKRRATRFVSEDTKFSDEVNLVSISDGERERSLKIGRKNFSVKFDTEDDFDEYETLKLAEIVRTDEGFALKKDFIPMCISIDASRSLMVKIRSILEQLVTKSDSLWNRRREQSSGQIEFTGSELTILGILQTTNSFIPILNHFNELQNAHPEEVYKTFLSLAAQLTTFARGSQIRPRKLPIYDHDNLSECFNQLYEDIMILLSEVVPDNCVVIPLEKEGYFYRGKVSDESLFYDARFYFVASSETIEERRIMDEVPGIVKVAAPNVIHKLTGAYVKAIHLTYVSRPPAGAPAKPGLFYFRWDQQGPFWEAIRNNRELAVFVPDKLKGLKVEIYAIKQDT